MKSDKLGRYLGGKVGHASCLGRWKTTGGRIRLAYWLMMSRLLRPFYLLLLMSTALLAVEVEINGPETWKTDSMFALSGDVKSETDTGRILFWIPSPDAENVQVLCTEQTTLLASASEPGTYHFHLVGQDDAGEAYGTFSIKITGKTADPPDDPPDDPDDPDDPPPGDFAAVKKASADGARKLGDRVTAQRLSDAMEDIQPAPTLDESKDKVRATIELILLTRGPNERQFDWADEWRVPVAAAIEAAMVTTTDQYMKAIAAVVDGLDQFLVAGVDMRINCQCYTIWHDGTMRPTVFVFKCPPCTTCVCSKWQQRCEDWRRFERPILSGWRVVETVYHGEDIELPSFQICGRFIEGFKTARELQAELDRGC